jgi:hypothetical protein
MEVLNNDILTQILTTSNITTSRDFKAVILVCRWWHHVAICNVKWYINTISTLMKRHPEIKWNIFMLRDSVTLEVLGDNQLTYNNRFMTNEQLNKFPKQVPIMLMIGYQHIESWLEANPDFKIDYNLLYINPHLSSAFITNHFDMFYRLSNGFIMCGHANFTLEMIQSTLNTEKHPLNLTMIIKNISGNPNITLELVTKYEKDINWTNLSLNNGLTLDIANAYIDKLDLLNVAQYAREEVIRAYHPRMNWRYISINPHLSLAFIEEHIDKIAFDLIWHNKNITESFIAKWLDKKPNWCAIMHNNIVSIEFAEAHLAAICEDLMDK